MRKTTMKLQEVRAIAQQHNIKPEGQSKADLIRKIQLNEGYFDCFATASNSECGQVCCQWRGDCLVSGD
jgi:hypothetical protein